MKRLAYAMVVLAALACLQTAPAATTTHRMEHQGKERTFLLAVPDAPPSTRALPLIVALHPYPSNGTSMAELTGFSQLAEREGFLVAYPDGIDGGFNALMCCGNEDDSGFIRAVVEKISAEHAVDRTRVFATGISNGADLTYRLAAELPGVFSAIAPVSGGMTGDWIQKKTGNLPSKPTSLVTFYGKRDRFYDVFMTGSKFWFERLGCSATTSMLDGSSIEVTRGDCADGSSAEVYVLPDMGHAWPGATNGSLTFPTSPIKATELIWKFFNEHPAK